MKNICKLISFLGLAGSLAYIFWTAYMYDIDNFTMGRAAIRMIVALSVLGVDAIFIDYLGKEVEKVPNEIVYTVKRADVVIQDKRMSRLIQDANSVGPSSTYKDLNDAYRALNIARGFYEALSGLGILDLQSMVGEDIERIEQKILELKEEKYRMDLHRIKR